MHVVMKTISKLRLMFYESTHMLTWIVIYVMISLKDLLEKKIGGKLEEINNVIPFPLHRVRKSKEPATPTTKAKAKKTRKRITPTDDFLQIQFKDGTIWHISKKTIASLYADEVTRAFNDVDDDLERYNAAFEGIAENDEQLIRWAISKSWNEFSQYARCVKYGDADVDIMWRESEMSLIKK